MMAITDLKTLRSSTEVAHLGRPPYKITTKALTARFNVDDDDNDNDDDDNSKRRR